MLHGLDCSSYQGNVPWERVASDLSCRFAIVKVAEGLLSSPDPWAARNTAGARQAGLRVGGYFFLHPEKDPESQARLHWKLAQDVSLAADGDLPFAVDFESPSPASWAASGLTAAELRAKGLAYCQAIQALSGAPPLLYTYADFWSHLQGALEPRFAGFPLWMASYPSGNSWPVAGAAPLIPRPWTSWAVWQWTGGGKLPNGVADDFDVFWGEEDDLIALCVARPSRPSTPPASVPEVA